MTADDLRPAWLIRADGTGLVDAAGQHIASVGNRDEAARILADRDRLHERIEELEEDLADVKGADEALTATRQMVIRSDAALRAVLLSALNLEDDGRTPVTEYIAALVVERDAALAQVEGMEIDTKADADALERLRTIVAELETELAVEKASFMAQMKNEAHHRNLLTAALARVAGLEAAAKKSRCPEVDALWAAIWRDQKKLDVALGQLSRGRLVTFGGRVNDLLDAIDYVIGRSPAAGTVALNPPISDTPPPPMSHNDHIPADQSQEG